MPNAVPDATPAPQPEAAAAPSPAGSHRAPFVVLLCCLLGGALVSALVISTTLAAGSFRITNLQQSTNALARQRQALEEQVAQAQSAQTIETQALELGMRPTGEIRFIDLKTGKTSSDAATGWESEINVPGYTP
jgi:multidrug efflux pump subunit AcrA (membrane-fusion protein)